MPRGAPCALWGWLVQAGAGPAGDVAAELEARVSGSIGGWAGPPDLWTAPEWRGVLLAPELVEALRRQDAAEGTGFMLASLSRRVAPVASAWAAAHWYPRGHLTGWARRRPYHEAGGYADAADLRERPRSDGAAEMVSVAQRLLAGQALDRPALVAGQKAALREDRYLLAHRADHGGIGDCPHARAVVHFALAIPLLRAADAALPAATDSSAAGPGSDVIDAKLAELVAAGVPFLT